MWRVTVVGAPVKSAIEELVNVAVVTVANRAEGVVAAADMRDGGLVRCGPAKVIQAQATNGADEGGFVALIECQKARDATFGDGFVDYAGFR